MLFFKVCFNTIKSDCYSVFTFCTIKKQLVFISCLLKSIVQTKSCFVLICFIDVTFYSFTAAIDFQLAPTQHSADLSFSLTCNLTGGEVSAVIWTRDGFLLDNTGPLVLTDTTTHYVNVLEVNGRTRGTYTCQAIGVDNQVLSSATIDVQG